ncbi:MAG: hypothetical protein GX604_08715 [Actinobacteria bacterium]|nr:hypothetical protein [Actinomycetota bacterium]
MKDWAKLRMFLWGGILGSLIGLLLTPNRHGIPSQSDVTLEAWEELIGAPCATGDDGYV